MKAVYEALPIWFLLAIGIMCIGCCHVVPDENQVKSWVHAELPYGSTENDVMRFSARHHFIYERDHNDASYAQAYRGLDGCDWERPVAKIDIRYDSKGLVTEADVILFSIGLP